ncbi:MAG: tripartite tricarboxylate transporter substrate binding protein [Herminiimonas sp.]|nr:tripartite tricarboxylate transporter substrate binding protein [Herminiimonas sp.]MDB5852187.1 tripartite tricarboxylate transporter substrate binding protein [Herminiimonas sp.]
METAKVLSARFIIPAKLLLALAAWLTGGECIAIAATPHSQECIVPSKPGGGFDLTCKLAQRALAPTSPGTDVSSIRLSYLPGGIGAVAWHSVVTQRRAETETLVAFSGGSLLNLALGKFGNGSTDDVRWVAAVGTDYGMIAVRADSPYRNLGDLVAALKQDPRKVVIGAGGTVGSQDWLKVAQVAKQGGVDPKALRFVAFEGGGESFTALLAGHVQAVSGDASEAVLHSSTDRIRVLAVLSDARLAGPLSNVPTAREQGFDVTWPILRGYYMGPDVPDADYRRWVAAFDRAMADKSFAALRASAGLYPFAMTGATLTAYVKKTEETYRHQAKEFGLLR